MVHNYGTKEKTLPVNCRSQIRFDRKCGQSSPMTHHHSDDNSSPTMDYEDLYMLQRWLKEWQEVQLRKCNTNKKSICENRNQYNNKFVG